jgi:hypothetical protein
VVKHGKSSGRKRGPAILVHYHQCESPRIHVHILGAGIQENFHLHLRVLSRHLRGMPNANSRRKKEERVEAVEKRESETETERSIGGNARGHTAERQEEASWARQETRNSWIGRWVANRGNRPHLREYWRNLVNEATRKELDLCVSTCVAGAFEISRIKRAFSLGNFVPLSSPIQPRHF